MAENKASYYESAEYIAKVVDTYQSSHEFEEELYEKSNAFYDRSCAHILRQFHQFILDKALMCRAYESSYANLEFRNGCNFIPFTESELSKIVVTDLKELCDQLRGRSMVVEPSPQEPIPVGEPAVVQPSVAEIPTVEEGASVEACPASIKAPSHM